uniref:Peroxiredoxin like 2B n=1 Tax=Cyprinus carpio TaxID=7962 RepID=A0A8C2G6G1_CYPCA
ISSVNLTSLGANQVKNTTSGEQTIQLCFVVIRICSLFSSSTWFGCQVCKVCLTALKTVSQCKNVSLCSGGEKVLLHFVQKTPADIAGEKPQVKQEEFVRSSLFDTAI